MLWGCLPGVSSLRSFLTVPVPWGFQQDIPFSSEHCIPLLTHERTAGIFLSLPLPSCSSLEGNHTLGPSCSFGLVLQGCSRAGSLLPSPNTGLLVQSPRFSPRLHARVRSRCVDYVLCLTSFSRYSAGAGGLLSGPELRGNRLVKAAISSLVFAICSSTLILIPHGTDPSRLTPTLALPAHCHPPLQPQGLQRSQPHVCPLAHQPTKGVCLVYPPSRSYQSLPRSPHLGGGGRPGAVLHP